MYLIGTNDLILSIFYIKYIKKVFYTNNSSYKKITSFENWKVFKINDYTFKKIILRRFQSHNHDLLLPLTIFSPRIFYKIYCISGKYKGTSTNVIYLYLYRSYKICI